METVKKITSKQKQELLNLLIETLSNKYNGKTRIPHFWDALREYTDIFSKYVKDNNIEDWWTTESYCYQRVWKQIKWSDDCVKQ